MKFSHGILACVLAAVGPTTITAFAPISHRRRSVVVVVQRASAGRDIHEFDHILREGPPSTSTESRPIVSRRRIALTSRDDSHATVLASSFAAPGDSTEETTGTAAEDPYADSFESQLQKINQFQETQSQTGGVGGGLEQKLKGMDFQDLVITLFIPGIALFVAGRWGYNRVSGRVQESTDMTLDAFAKEMIYHDGDFQEMELCAKDYNRRLVWLGPSKTETMLKRYLQTYVKKKTVSPRSISSLSYVFTIFKLSEEKAAKLLVSLCRDMGGEKISSSGKLLFLGSRILKSPEGVKALEPIKTMIMATYRDEAVADTLVETSQQAMAEAAYRAAVQQGGKKQKSLTKGWEVLGLSREKAQEIFTELADEGFMTDRETMYGGQSRKYDKKGRQIDEETGELANPEEAEDEDEADDEPVSNVYECSQCGFTLFVAQGRETKFYGNDFKCPECGAPKDKFQARDDLDD